MKKAIALFLLLVLALSLASCGKSNNDEKNTCINCDAKNAIDAKFCSACGKSLDNIDNDEKNEEDDNTPTPETAICVQCESECQIGHSYCEEHECEKEACIMQKKSNSKFCVAHSCIYCGYERFGDLAWCSVHNCYWSGCKIPMQQAENHTIVSNTSAQYVTKAELMVLIIAQTMIIQINVFQLALRFLL